MQEENIINQDTTSAEPSAEGSAKEEWLPTKEAAKLVGTSARTLKRRADLGTLRRTSIHTQFGIETRYNIRELEKLKQDLHQKSAEAAEAIAEVNAELRGRHAEGADLHLAGGDTRSRSLAEVAEVTKIIDQKIAKITDPFFKLAAALETGFERLLHFQELTAKSQARMIEIEVNRDLEKQKEREEAKKKVGETRIKTRITIIGYITVIFTALGVLGYLFWLIYGERIVTIMKNLAWNKL